MLHNWTCKAAQVEMTAVCRLPPSKSQNLYKSNLEIWMGAACAEQSSLHELPFKFKLYAVCSYLILLPATQQVGTFKNFLFTLAIIYNGGLKGSFLKYQAVELAS